MQNTKHYNLKKPDANDYYSVNDSNSNMDIIDEELNKLSESNKKTQETINNFIEGETSEKIKASNVSIQDAGNKFNSSDVEGALQEVMEEVKKALQNGVDIKDAVRDAINSKLTVPDLPNNATWNDIINSIIQIKEGGGNAQPGDVLQGKTFTNDSGQELTGTMPNRGNGGTITPSTQNQTKPKGYYSSDIVVLGDADLNPNNIKKNVNIFGVTGNVIQATGNAQASQVLNGVTFSNSNGSGTGNMPNRGGARTITPSTTNQTLSSGYYSGNITVAGSGNLKPENIKNGINIFGIIGTLEYKPNKTTLDFLFEPTNNNDLSTSNGICGWIKCQNRYLEMAIPGRYTDNYRGEAETTINIPSLYSILKITYTIHKTGNFSTSLVPQLYISVNGQKINLNQQPVTNNIATFNISSGTIKIIAGYNYQQGENDDTHFKITNMEIS